VTTSALYPRVCDRRTAFGQPDSNSWYSQCVKSGQVDHLAGLDTAPTVWVSCTRLDAGPASSLRATLPTRPSPYSRAAAAVSGLDLLTSGLVWTTV